MTILRKIHEIIIQNKRSNLKDKSYEEIADFIQKVEQRLIKKCNQEEKEKYSGDDNAEV